MMVTVTEVIEGGAQKIGLYPTDQPVESEIFNRSVKILKKILKSYNNTPVIIAYNEELTFPLVSGKKEYTIGEDASNDVVHQKPILIDDINVVSSSTAYPVKIITQHEYYKNSRSLINSSFPCYVMIKRKSTSVKIIFLANVQTATECIINGKFELPDITKVPFDLEVIPPEYQLFLEYALARELAQNYGGWNALNEKIYQEKVNEVISNSDLDCELRQELFFPIDYTYFQDF